MRRLKYEKETIILTNEDDGFYDVYTFNQSLQKRLRAFAEKYPDDCWLKGSSEDGSETYIIKKGRLSLNLRPPYSKDRIHKATPIYERLENFCKDAGHTKTVAVERALISYFDEYEEMKKKLKELESNQDK